MRQFHADRRVFKQGIKENDGRGKKRFCTKKVLFLAILFITASLLVHSLLIMQNRRLEASRTTFSQSKMILIEVQPGSEEEILILSGKATLIDVKPSRTHQNGRNYGAIGIF